MKRKINTFNAMKVKSCLAEYGMKQDELAKRIGISESTLSFKLTGKNEFKVSEIEEIAYIFKKEISYFFN